jgi:pseudoazurin
MQRKDDLLTILLTLANPVALIIVAISLFSLSSSIRNLSSMAHPHEHGQPISIAIGAGGTLVPSAQSPDVAPQAQPSNNPTLATEAVPHHLTTTTPETTGHHNMPGPAATPPSSPHPSPATEVKEAAPTGVNHVVQALNNSPEGAMVFSPGYLKIAPGDSITFKPTSYGHNSQTPEDIIGDDYLAIPQGAKPWAGAMNEEVTITFTVPGVYLYLCNYHYVVGHVGVIQVGDDTSNLEEVKKAGRALKNKMFSNADRVDLYLAQVQASPQD